jgi:hypothetical protein
MRDLQSGISILSLLKINKENQFLLIPFRKRNWMYCCKCNDEVPAPILPVPGFHVYNSILYEESCYFIFLQHGYYCFTLYNFHLHLICLYNS